MKPPAKVFIVDDHELLRQGLVQLIADEPDLTVCGEAEDAPAALRMISQVHPDIVVIDLSLKEGDGIELIKMIKAGHRNLPVLVLTMHEESFYAERALRAGALGYLTKQEASESVLVAIRRLLQGELYLSDRLSPALLQKLITGSTTEGETLVSRLSDRELQVFVRIGEGCSTQEIADQLHLSVKTIETYRAHIKEKLGMRDARELVRYAMRWTINRK